MEPILSFMLHYLRTTILLLLSYLVVLRCSERTSFFHIHITVTCHIHFTMTVNNVRNQRTLPGENPLTMWISIWLLSCMNMPLGEDIIPMLTFMHSCINSYAFQRLNPLQWGFLALKIFIQFKYHYLHIPPSDSLRYLLPMWTLI